MPETLDYDRLLTYARDLFASDEFVHRPGVPVFGEHVLRDPDGKVIRTFEKEDLEKIVAACNARISDTNDFAALSEGHVHGTNDPAVLGFAGPFRLAKVGRDNPRYAVLQDEWVYKDRAEEVRRKPRRSVELDERDNTLDPIAVLGSRPPKLDMGLKFEKEGRTKYQATYPAGSNPTIAKFEEEPMNEELTGQLIAALESLDWVQWCKKKAAEESASLAPANEPPVDQFESDEDKAEVPGEEVEPKDDKLKFEKLSGDLTSLRSQYEKAAAENKAIKTTMDVLLRDKEDTRRASEIQKLSYEKCIDVATEEKRCLYGKGSAMSGAEFDSHVAVIRQYASDSPVGQTLPNGYAPTDGGALKFEKEREWADEAVRRYERSHREGRKVTYDEVYADVKAGK